MKLQELREYLDSAKDDKWNSLSFGIDEAEQLVAVAEAAKRLCDEATPGPWIPAYNNSGQRSITDALHLNIWSWLVPNHPNKSLAKYLAWETDSGQDGYGLSKQDVEFISMARTIMPKLIAVAEAALKHEQICEDASDSLQGLAAALRLLK